MGYSEEDLYELQRKLIRKYKCFSKLKPAPIKIVDTNESSAEVEKYGIFCVIVKKLGTCGGR